MMITNVLSQKVLTFPSQYLLNHSHQNMYFLLFMSMIFGYDNFTVGLENSGNRMPYVKTYSVALLSDFISEGSETLDIASEMEKSPPSTK